MPIGYVDAPDVKRRVDGIIERLGLSYIKKDCVFCVRSRGSSSIHTVARIHGLGRIWQETLNLTPAYIIEVISERYDRLPEEEKDKTLIHELLHIPKGFKGGFRPHKGYITRRKIEQLYRKLKNSTKQ
mgnify:CR=1 FL=1